MAPSTGGLRTLAELLEVATAFQRSQTLFTFVRLGIPTLLGRRPLPLADLARSIRLHASAAQRLLNAGVALGLVVRAGTAYRNAPAVQRWLVRGVSSDLVALIERYRTVDYRRWEGLARHLRSWRSGGRGRSHRVTRDDLESLEAQHDLSLWVGEELATGHDLSRHRAMVDLGGGTAATSIALCRRHRKLQSTVLDFPPVAALARRHVRRSGLGDRIRVRSCDILTDRLPRGFDLAVLASTISMLSESDARALLARIHDGLDPGGTLLVSGWILDDNRRTPLLAVLFCLEDINWRALDVERSASTYAGWLREAGFGSVRRRTIAAPWSVMIARKRDRSRVARSSPSPRNG